MSAVTPPQIEDIDVSSVGDAETAKNRSTTLTDLPPELIELVVIHLQLDLESSNGRSSNRYWASMISYSAAVAGPNDPSTIYSMNSKRRRAEFYDVFHFSSICRYFKQVMTSFRPYKELYLEGTFRDFGESWGYGSSFPSGVFFGIRPVLDSSQSDSHVPLLTTDLFLTALLLLIPQAPHIRHTPLSASPRSTTSCTTFQAMKSIT